MPHTFPLQARRKILRVLVWWLASLAGSASCDELTPMPLPACPAHCSIHVYGPINKAPASLGFPSLAKRTSDWKSYFEADGIVFPKGGFAYFYQPSKTLIIAATPDPFALLETIMASGGKTTKPGH